MKSIKIVLLFSIIALSMPGLLVAGDIFIGTNGDYPPTEFVVEK